MLLWRRQNAAWVCWRCQQAKPVRWRCSSCGEPLLTVRAALGRTSESPGSILLRQVGEQSTIWWRSGARGREEPKRIILPLPAPPFHSMEREMCVRAGELHHNWNSQFFFFSLPTHSHFPRGKLISPSLTHLLPLQDTHPPPFSLFFEPSPMLFLAELLIFNTARTYIRRRGPRLYKTVVFCLSPYSHLKNKSRVWLSWRRYWRCVGYLFYDLCT